MGRENFQTEWVQKAREQDQEALEALYVCCYSEVYKTILEATSADGDTIKDILQETYIRAFTKLDTLIDDSKFQNWIHSIAHNAAKDFVRKYKPNLFDSLDAVDEDGVPELQLENQDIETMPQIQMDQQETTRLVREILDSLSAGQRLAITMYYYEHMTIEEIARHCGVREGTIKAQLHFGKEKMKEKVLELEKQGTKLYGLLPFPFFVMLLRNLDSVQIPVDYTLWNRILQQCGIQAAPVQTTDAPSSDVAPSTQDTAPAATISAAKTTGTAAGSAIKGKIAAGLVAVSILGVGGTVAGIQYMNHQTQTGVVQEQEPVSSNRDAPEQKQSPTVPTPTSSTDSPEVASYRTLLNTLQEDGTFLQYAHLKDLNGDGTQELILLHDNTDLTIYQMKRNQPKAVYEKHAVNGFMCYEEAVTDETYEQAYEEMGKDAAGVKIDCNPSEHKISVTPLDDNWLDEAHSVIVDCDTWDEVGEEDYYDGSSEGYQNISLAGISQTEEFSDQLSYLLGKSDTMAAYERFLQYEDRFLDAEACYEYIYLDDDDVPELVVSENSSFGGQVTLYRCKDGLVIPVKDQLGSNGDIYYKERENQLLSKVNKDSGKAVLYQLQKDELVAEQTSSFSMDAEGNILYEIDGKSVSTEQGETFWDMDGTAYLAAGQDGENAVHFHEDTYLNE